MKSSKPKPSTTVASQFVRAHLGKSAFAPLTGTDWRAWNAFVYLLELWGVSRDPRSVEAMRATLACAQSSVMDVFIQTIPAMLDWCNVRELWPLIAPSGADEGLYAVDLSFDGKRITRYRGYAITAGDANKAVDCDCTVCAYSKKHPQLHAPRCYDRAAKAGE